MIWITMSLIDSAISTDVAGVCVVISSGKGLYDDPFTRKLQLFYQENSAARGLQVNTMHTVGTQYTRGKEGNARKAGLQVTNAVQETK